MAAGRPTHANRLATSSAVVAMLAISAVGLADSLVSPGVPPQRVTVTGFADGKLRYTTERGDPAEREYARVQQLIVDSETALSAAEAARISNQADVALDGYAKAIRGTTAAWAKAYAARRILDANTTRFEPRLAAYLALVQVAPSDAAAAKPALPDKGSQLLDVAVAETEAVLKTPKLTDAARLVAFDFLADLHTRRGDEAAANATVERLVKTSPAAAADPAVRSRLAGIKVARAKGQLDRKEYAAARSTITDARAEITDPVQQADALYVLAQVRLAVADPTDTAARQDAAIAFMRVVTVAEALPGKPNVLASLRATAGILEQTGDKPGATRLYLQIARDFADDPAAAAEAKADAARVGR